MRAKQRKQPRRNPSGSHEWRDYAFESNVVGHPGGEKAIQKGWSSNASDDRLLAEAQRRYVELHGIPPQKTYEQKLPPQPKMLVDLGPITKVCYTKRIRSDLQEHAHLPPEERPVIDPLYCHDYGEGWPEGRFDELADRAAVTERGDLYVVPRGNTVVTARGIEDKPVKPNHAVRANPDRSRRNPDPTTTALVQMPVKLQKAKQQSAIGVFFSTILAGAIGIPGPIVLRAVLMKGSPLSPAQRGAFTAIVSVLAGMILGVRSPRVGSGVALAGLTMGGVDALEYLELTQFHSTALGAPEISPQAVQPAESGQTTR